MQEKSVRKVILPKTIEEVLKGILGTKGIQVTYLTEGVSTDVYKVLAGNETYYFRLKDEGESSTAECLVHKLINEAGVKAPKIVYSEDFNSKLGRSFLITTEIKGKSIFNTKTNSDQVLYEAGKDLALINSIPLKGFGWVDQEISYQYEPLGMYSNYKDFWLEDLDKKLHSLVSTGRLDKKVLKHWTKHIKRIDIFLSTIDQAYLAHGDFGTPHIYHNDGVYTGIIDFGDTRATSIYYDLAQFYTYFPEAFNHLLKGYKTITTLPSDYMQSVEIEALLFSISRLNYLAIHLPDHLMGINHPTKVLIEFFMAEK